MTCSTRFGRLLQASCLGLIGMLAVIGCGGSETTKKDSSVPVTPPPDGGLTGVVSVDTALLKFDPIDVGLTSLPKTVTVTVTVAPAATNATVTGDGFLISANTCAPTQPVGTCTISVVFAPTKVGAATGKLSVGSVDVALSGTGTEPGVFSLTPEIIPLGTMLLGTSAPAVVTITPAGTVPSISCLSTGADLSLLAQTCPPTGTAVAIPCTYTYTFKALSVGDKVDTIVCSGGGKTAQTTVTAKVVTPSALSISPAKKDDFVAKVGQAAPWVFNVNNNGGSSTGTLTANVTGAGFSITSNECPAQLAAAASCKIQVTFAPTVASVVTGALTVTDATPGSTPATAALTGTGIASAIAITPTPKDFGTVEVGKSATLAFTMTNSGTSPTDIVALAIADAQFTVVNDLCGGHTLAALGSPQASCTFGITFAPASAGLKQAVVNATQTSDGAVLATASISGTGLKAPTLAHLVITPPTLDFGTTGIGVPVGPKVFTVTNDGDLASGALTTLKNDSTSSVGGASQFNITGNTCAVALASKGTCQVAVTFAPTIDRSASAVIVVTDGVATTSPPGTSGTIPPGTVVGIALAIPQVTMNCKPTDDTVPEGAPLFDDTVTGDTSPAAVCTIKNETRTGGGGDTPQATGAITVTVTGPFAVAVNNCTASLDPGLTCTVSLVFKPTAKGKVTGMATVTTANRGAANQPLEGVGLLPVEIVEHIATAYNATHNPDSVVTDYDFGQVSQGASSGDAEFGSTILTLDVYVRKPQLGNIAITGEGAPGVAGLWWWNDTAKGNFKVIEGSTCKKLDSRVYTATEIATGNPYCFMYLTFTPQTKGAKAVTIKAASAEAAGGSDTAGAKGTGTGPLTIQPSPLTFDAVAVGSASLKPLTMTVCNHANSAAENAALTITGANASDFVVVDDTVTHQTIPAHACPEVLLRLDIPADGALGPRTATMTVSATIAGVAETVSADMLGTVVGGASITVTASGPFADTAMTNYSGPIVFTVKNTGAMETDELHFDIPDQKVTTTGIYGDFFWDPTLHSTLGLVQGTCAPSTADATYGIGIRLDPGASCTLNVWFMPNPSLGAVQRNSILIVTTPVGGRKVIDLTGKATPQLVISQGATSPVTSVTVGPTAFRHTNGPTTDITITNRGGVDIDTSDLSLDFVDAVGQTGEGLFQRLLKTGTTCPTIGKAGSHTPPDFCIYTLRMYAAETPDMPGARSTTLEVTNTDNGTQKATVVVNGTAVAPPKLEFTPASLVNRDFGPVVFSDCATTSSPSRALTFTLTNTGGMRTDAITAKDVYVPCPDTTPAYQSIPWSQCESLGKTGDFIVTGCSTESGSLNPAASCVLSVAFNPTSCHPSTGSHNTQTPIAWANNVQLKVTYPLEGVPTTLQGPLFAGSAVDRTALPYIVESAGGLAPYDFGMVTATSAKVTLAVHNDSATTFNTPALSTMTITGVVADTGLALGTIPGEFEVMDPGTLTGACALAGGTELTGGQNESCKFIVKWTPTTTVGTREVNVMFDVGGPSIDIIGRVPTMPHLVALTQGGTYANPPGAPIDFGDAVVTVASASRVITIQNQGERATDGPLSVIGASGFTGTDAVSTTGCEVQLAPGATCVLTAAATPSATGAPPPSDPVPAVVFQLANDDESNLLTLAATWVGKSAAKITRSPTDTTIDFDEASTVYGGYGTPVLSDGTGVDITLSNSVATAIKTGPMTFQTDNDDYSIDLDTAHSTCLGASFAFDGLKVGQATCIVRVIFSPTALMATPPSTGNLIIKSANAATVTVPLSGTPIPVVSVAATGASAGTFTATTATAPAKLVYGATSVVNVGGYPVQEFTFTKATGSPPTGLLSTSIGGGTGTTPDQFKIVEDSCIGVALQVPLAGHDDWSITCKVKVRFAPTSVGNKSATLTVTDPTSGTPVEAISVALSGVANP
jgi:hypothetical protein